MLCLNPFAPPPRFDGEVRRVSAPGPFAFDRLFREILRLPLQVEENYNSFTNPLLILIIGQTTSPFGQERYWISIERSHLDLPLFHFFWLPPPLFFAP